MTSSLERLPEEVRAHVFSHVTEHADLLSLSLVSKIAHKSAAPVLYRQFYSGDTCKPVRRFLRTLCKNDDDLATRVLSLDLALHQERPFTAPTSYDNALFDAALKQGMKAGLLRDQVMSASQAGCHSAELLAICCLSTNITTLQVDLEEQAQRAIDPDTSITPTHYFTCSVCSKFGECIRSIICPSHSRIEKVTLRGARLRTNGSTVSQRVLFDFLSLKSLRSLRFDSLTLPSPYQAANHQARSSNVRNISFPGASIQASAMVDVLNSCRSLDSFDLRICIKNGTVFLDVDPIIWYTALCRHRASLKTITLCNDANLGFVLQSHPVFSTLIHFEALATLTIHETLLVGESGWKHANLETVLPRSISKLHIQSYGELSVITNMLIALGGWKPTKFVSLDIIFDVVGGGMNSEYTMSWQRFHYFPGEYYPSPDQCMDYDGTCFVVVGGGSCRLQIMFKCTELEVCRNFAGLGSALDDGGLERFLEAAEDQEEISLWDGGPKRHAISMFFDDAMYSDDESSDEE